MKLFLIVVLLWFFSPSLLFSNDSTLILSGERQAMNCKTSLMLQAKHSISLSYYAINEDEVGLKFAAVACYKAQQGIPVKIIIEKSRSKITRNLVQLFKECGVEIKYYNSFRVYKLFKNFSWLHDKLLVIDSAYVVIGGRNLNDKYYPSSESESELVDIETLVKGQAGADAQQYIHHLFNSKFADKAKVKHIDTTRYNYLRSIIVHNIDSIKKLNYRNWDTLLSPVKDVNFVHDNYKKWPKSKAVANTVYSLIKQSRRNLTIVSPYLIPPLKFMRALKAARKRGVDITLISNSAQVSDAKIIAAAYMNDRKKYLKRKIHVYEYNGKKMLHDKLFLADDSITIVGSYNFDNISYHMNAEVITKIKDASFANKISKHIVQRKLDCFKVEHAKDVNPYNDKLIVKSTKWNRVLLKIFPFIRRFL